MWPYTENHTKSPVLPRLDKDNYGHSNSNDKTRDSKCVKRDGFLDGKTLYDGKEDTTIKSEGGRGYYIIEDEVNDGLMIHTSELLDHLASPEKIIQDIEQIFPNLSPNRLEIKEFIERSSKLPFTPHYTPVKEKHPSDWSSVSPWVDKWWQKSIDQEPRPTNTPEWIPAAASARVKPVGCLDAKLMVITSYALMSPVHPDFATADDLSSAHIDKIYHKFGYDTEKAASTKGSMLHLLTIPIQMHSNRQNTCGITTCPEGLRRHWEIANAELITRSQARIVLVFGAPTQAAYIQSLRYRKVAFRSCYCSFTQCKRPSVLFEYTPNGSLNRIAILVRVPESFTASKSKTVPMGHRANAVEERLLDVAVSILLEGGFVIPGLLSSRQFFKVPRTALIIHTSTLLGPETEIAALFRCPSSRLTVLKDYIQSWESLAPRAKRIMSIIQANRIILGQSDSYWRNPQRVVEYGPHAITFELLWIAEKELTQRTNERKLKKKREPIKISN
ncbi:hypothetical protein PTT_07823 [Pyrenophora teres f. teres 0-1]|uniref:Uncharacterized protein n=1 Tax=Pyrenophora teres f. teres (strain 0-1) TaxID=861557 RepID=E3RIG2_PYRTT|nr:hypothetical protein PTT_07823 [Pyrenophora teres f. teres 0-1]